MGKKRLVRHNLLRLLLPLSISMGMSLSMGISFSAYAEAPTPQRQNELRNLLEQDCGSCHGMTLKGGLGPALTAEALKDKPIELLSVTIREGRPGTPMPPWKFLLSDSDINWLALTLKKQVMTKSKTTDPLINSSARMINSSARMINSSARGELVEP